MKQNNKLSFALRETNYNLKEKSRLSKKEDSTSTNYVNQSVKPSPGDTGVRYRIRNLISNQIGELGFGLTSQFDKASQNSVTVGSIVKTLVTWYNSARPLLSFGVKLASSRIVYIPILVVLLTPGILVVLLVLAAMFGVSSVTIGLFTITTFATFIGFTFVVIPGLMVAAITGASAYLVYTVTGSNRPVNPKLEAMQQGLRVKLHGTTNHRPSGVYEVVDETGDINGGATEVDYLSGAVIAPPTTVDDEDMVPSPLVADSY